MSRLMLAATLSLCAPTVAFACGAFVEAESVTSEVSLDAQRVIFHLRGERLEITTQVVGSSAAASFAWVLPIPADDAATVDVGTNEVFGQLDELTKPTVTFRVDDSGGGCSLGCGAAKGGDAGNSRGEEVDVFASGTAGDYEYAIVGGAAGATITTYLQDEGYAVPDALDEALSAYVDAGMRFVAVKLTDEAIDADSFAADPIVVDVAMPSELVFPLGLSAGSAPEETELLLYVIADEKYLVADATMLTSRDVANEIHGDSSLSYRDATRNITFGEGSRFVIDAARPVSPAQCAACGLGGERFVTRIYSVMARADLADFSLLGTGDTEPVESQHFATRGAPADALGYAFVPLLFLLLRRRRR